MADPIRGVNRTGAIEVAQTEQSRAAPATPNAAPPETVPVDSADVSSAESLLATISTLAREVPLIDEARVAELQQALKAGAYQINPQQIAEKIVEIERLLSPGTGTR
jgi:negative regulator of flagellin synthesis FlgM